MTYTYYDFYVFYIMQQLFTFKKSTIMQFSKKRPTTSNTQVTQNAYEKYNDIYTSWLLCHATAVYI